MYKYIDFFYGDNNSEVLTLVHPGTLEKRAELSSELLEYIKHLTPKPGYTYALVNALSAGEYFSSNRNGDYFPEEALKEYHKTFEALGHVYRHHINKDPNKSLGKVIFSHYNQKMHRVELILEIDNSRAKDIIEKLQAGGLPATSMGARVPYDECSICHKRAKNRAEYCEHLLTQMNRILPDGRKVYAINRHPKFFDISIVVVPAEKTSGFLKVFNDFKNNLEKNEEKFASYVEDAYTKIAELDSFAEIKKQVPGEDVVVSKNPKELANLMRHANSKLSENVLCKLSEFPFTETLSTMLGLRILPSKADFQKLALLSFGLEKEAKELEANNIIFEPNTINIDTDISLDHFNTKIAEVLQPEVANLALTKELIIARELVKKAEEWQPPQPPPERSMISRVLFGNEPDPKLTPHKNPIIPLSIIGSLYYGYAKLFNDPSKATFRSFIGKNPWLMPVLVAGATGASILTQDAIFTKTAGSIDKFVRNSLITFPTSYIIAGKYENDAQQGQPISKMQNLVRKHPALTAILGSLAGVKAENSIRKLASFVGQLPENIKEDVYKTLMEE